MNKVKQWLGQIRNWKKDQILIVLLTGILLLVIAIPAEEKEAVSEIQIESTDSGSGSLYLDEKEKLENQLQNLLSEVEGVGEVRVMITFRSDGRKIVEKDSVQTQEKEENNTDGQSSSSVSASSDESTVYQRDSQGNEIPYVTEQESPEITGVLVIAQGGGNAVVKQEITEAVMALFGVEAHKIKVMRMK